MRMSGQLEGHAPFGGVSRVLGLMIEQDDGDAGRSAIQGPRADAGPGRPVLGADRSVTPATIKRPPSRSITA